MAVLESGGAPKLQELRLHNGTIYRWNRPIYDIARGRPHLRVENRVLPAGPTIVDTLANAAFYYGLVRVLVEDDRPVWTSMSFDAAARELLRGRARGHRRARSTGRASARRRRPSWCCAACCRWPATGLAALGRRLRRRRPPARDHRAPLRPAGQRRLLAGRGLPPPLRPPRPRRRPARDDRPLPRAHALQRAGPHLAAPYLKGSDPFTLAPLYAVVTRQRSQVPALNARYGASSWLGWRERVRAVFGAWSALLGLAVARSRRRAGSLLAVGGGRGRGGGGRARGGAADAGRAAGVDGDGADAGDAGRAVAAVDRAAAERPSRAGRRSTGDAGRAGARRAGRARAAAGDGARPCG